MENIKIYFIERVDTNEWYYTKQEWAETLVGGFTILIPSWTKEPLVANRFTSIESLKNFLKCDTIFDCSIKCRIVEYEYSLTKKGEHEV